MIIKILSYSFSIYLLLFTLCQMGGCKIDPQTLMQ